MLPNDHQVGRFDNIFWDFYWTNRLIPNGQEVHWYRFLAQAAHKRQRGRSRKGYGLPLNSFYPDHMHISPNLSLWQT